MNTPPAGPQTGDAFGQVLARCWRAGVVPAAAYEIIERDDGSISAGDAVRYFAGAEELSRLGQWACAQAQGRTLDVGCGAGRHALAVAALGKDVVGMDPSVGAVEVARQRGLNAVVGAVENPPADLGAFDTLMLQGNNLGLLGSAEHAPMVLERLATLARPGARLIGSNLDPYEGDDPAHLAYHSWNRRRGRLPGQVRMRLRDGRLASPWFDYPAPRGASSYSPLSGERLEVHLWA